MWHIKYFIMLLVLLSANKERKLTLPLVQLGLVTILNGALVIIWAGFKVQK